MITANIRVHNPWYKPEAVVELVQNSYQLFSDDYSFGICLSRPQRAQSGLLADIGMLGNRSKQVIHWLNSMATSLE